MHKTKPMSVAPIFSLPHSKKQFLLLIKPSYKSQSITKISACALLNLDSKDCKHSEQLTRNGHHIWHQIKKPLSLPSIYIKGKNKKLQLQIKAPKPNSLFTHKYLISKYKKSNLQSSPTKIPQRKLKISTRTQNWGTLSITLPTKATPGTNNTSTTSATTSTNTLDTAEDQRLTHTNNKIFGKKAACNTKRKRRHIIRGRGLCVAKQQNSPRPKEINFYIPFEWRAKNWCLCLDETIAIDKAIKDAVLEDIHSTNPSTFTMLSFARNFW